MNNFRLSYCLIKLGCCLFLSALSGQAGGHLIADNGSKKVAIVDADGNLVWEHVVKKGMRDASRLANGNVLMQDGPFHVIEVSPDHKIVWEYRNENQMWGFQRLAADRTLIAVSGLGQLIHVDAEGNIVRQLPLKRDLPDPHLDTRIARFDGTNYLVAQPGDSSVREYDSDGQLVWEYHTEGEGRAGVYQADYTKDGNIVIALLQRNSIIIVNREKEIVWSYADEDLGYQVAPCAVQSLDNGNILFSRFAKSGPQAVEVNRTKKVVWTLDSDQLSHGITMIQRLE